MNKQVLLRLDPAAACLRCNVEWCLGMKEAVGLIHLSRYRRTGKRPVCVNSPEVLSYVASLSVLFGRGKLGDVDLTRQSRWVPCYETTGFLSGPG